MLNLEPHYSIIDAVYGMAYIAMKQSYCCMMGGLYSHCMHKEHVWRIHTALTPN